MLLLYSMQLGSVTTSGYDLQRLQAERKEWQQRNGQLELELAKFQSLAWVEVEAVRRLGMQRASRVTYLELPAPPPEPSDPTPDTPPAAAAPPNVGILGTWRGLLEAITPPQEARP
jgi:hypothetical protein